MSAESRSCSPEFAARRTRSDDEVIAEHCITCGDDGIEMTVLSLDAGPGLAWCTPRIRASEFSKGPEGPADAAGAEPELVEVSLVDAAAPGDRILVHAGTAIASLEART